MAEYSAGKEKGEVIVKNSAYTAEGKLISAIEGKARLLPNDPPRLAVSFGPVVPNEPNYYVIHVDEDCEHVVVGTPDRKSLWILSRKVPITKETSESLSAIAKEAGFDTQTIFIASLISSCITSAMPSKTVFAQQLQQAHPADRRIRVPPPLLD